MPRILKSMPQVALLLPASVKISRDMRRGVLRYVRQHGPWGLHILEGRQGEQKLTRMRAWGCTGIIGRLDTPELRERIRLARVPKILVDQELTPERATPRTTGHSLIRSDTAAVGILAAEYFLGLQYRHLAYVGEVCGRAWSVRRGQAFAERVARNGHACHTYGPLCAAEREDAGLERARLCAWLRALPKPVALLAAMDNRGHQVMDACAWAGIRVPQEIAVLGVDNDDDLCEATQPTMSSIQLDAERAGFEAARQLDRLMRGMTRRHTILLYGPLHVVPRGSTASSQLEDAVVLRALEFIALNACSGIGVPDVVAHVRASRRLAEQRFRSYLGRTILEEIRRVRIERVCMLLRETNLAIGEITRQCGFDSESHLGVLFRQRFGCAMRQYRNQRV